ncbi:MAG: ABC transporter substrate-binding protein [Candidatus Dormibacteria bacterium]
MRGRLITCLALLAVSATMVAGVSSTALAKSSSSPKGTVTFALQPGAFPTYILPFVSGSNSNNVDLFQFTPYMWRPLYWFGNGKGATSQAGINYAQSIGQAPVYSNGGRTVTITMNRDYRWSDGQPVTNRDVELWMNIFFVEKDNYLAYYQGSIPDDVTSMSFPSSTPYQFSITFNKAYSHLWLLYNQLSNIDPIPQHTWDKTSATGPVGDYDLTPSGATAVYNFLNSQSETESTYATNPLWKVVDGPWHLSAFSAATGYSAYVPNPTYGGPGKPKIAKLEEIPFTSDSAEFDALRSGALDYGYLPIEDLSQASYFTQKGYTIDKWTDFGFNDFFLNFLNPEVGSIFSQLYVRQAMQRLINQPEIVKDIYHGDAQATYGPIPVNPPNPYASKAVNASLYPFSVSAAKALLSSHGWTVHPGGTDVCSSPGTASNECGAGISRGALMSFNYVVSTGSAPFTAEVEAMQSDWSDAGIHLIIKQEPPQQIFSGLSPCSNGNSGCNWQIVNFGAPGQTPTYSPGYLPNGAQWFATNASNNEQGYSNAKMDSLIATTESSSAPSALQAFDLYCAQQLPNLFEPNYYYQVSVISNKLHGAVPQDPNLNLYPQYWTVS